MRRLVLVLVLVLMTPTISLAAAADDADGGPTFKRVTLVVSDLDRSLTIYRDILGFDLDGISDMSQGSYSYPVFRIDPAATCRFATLSVGTRQVRTLALVEVRGMDLPRSSAPLMTASVIGVEDLAATMERIEALGLQVTAPRRSGRPGEFTFVEQAFVDYDGHLIVLYQILEVVGEE